MAELTTNLKTDIRTKLKTVIDDVVRYGEEPSGTPVIYCVYKFSNKTLGFIDNTDSKTLALQIDIWYTSDDLKVIDGKADDIEALFNEQSFIKDNYYYDLYLTARQDQLPTTDNTHHTQLLFEVRYNTY